MNHRTKINNKSHTTYTMTKKAKKVAQIFGGNKKVPTFAMSNDNVDTVAQWIMPLVTAQKIGSSTLSGITKNPDKKNSYQDFFVFGVFFVYVCEPNYITIYY